MTAALEAVLNYVNKVSVVPRTKEDWQDFFRREDWSDTSQFVNWRNYVDDEIKKVWHHLKLGTQLALFAAAEVQACAEEPVY